MRGMYSCERLKCSVLRDCFNVAFRACWSSLNQSQVNALSFRFLHHKPPDLAPKVSNTPNPTTVTEPTHLRIWRHIDRPPPIVTFFIRLRTCLQQLQRGLPMPLTNRMMQRRQPIHIRRINRTPVLQQQLHDWHAPHCCGAVQRRLPALVPDAGGGLGCDQSAADVEVVLRGGEVEGGGAGGGREVGVGAFGEEERDEGLAGGGGEGARDHQRRPAGGVGHVGVEAAEGGKVLDDVEVRVGARPVEGQAAVIVDEGCELGIRL